MNSPTPEQLVFVDANSTGRTDNRETLPFAPEIFERIPMVANTSLPLSDTEDPAINLIRPSKKHGRAFEIRFGDQADRDPQLVFGDQYGNIYTSLGTKGNDCRLVVANYSSLEPSGLRVMGMQEGGEIIPVIAYVSGALRSAGVDTEWITASRQPKQFPQIRPETQSLELQPLRTFRNSIKTNSLSGGKRKNPSFPPANLDKLDEMKFVVTYRALKTPYRLNDLEILTDDYEGMRIMHSVITAHNLEEDIKARRDSDYEPVLIDHTPEDYHRFLIEVLPQKIGQNVAKMHNLGMWHKYLHSGNISLLGGIYDLDSVRYPEAFPEEEELTAARALDDLAGFLTGSQFTGLARVARAIFAASNESYAGLSPANEPANTYNFIANLFDSYLAERDFGDKPALQIIYREAQAKMMRDTEFILEHLPDLYSKKIIEAFDEEFSDRESESAKLTSSWGMSISEAISEQGLSNVMGQMWSVPLAMKLTTALQETAETYKEQLRTEDYNEADITAIMKSCEALCRLFVLSVEQTAPNKNSVNS